MAFPLTKDDLAYKAWVRAARGMAEKDSNLLLPHVYNMIDEAVKALCDQTAAGSDFARMQPAEKDVLLGSDGWGTLVDETMPDTVKPNRGGRVTHPSFNQPLVYKRNLRDLTIPAPGGSGPDSSNTDGEIGRFTIRGGNSSGGRIYCTKADGSPLTGTVKVLACVYYAYAAIPPELADELVMLLANLAKAKQSGG